MEHEDPPSPAESRTERDAAAMARKREHDDDLDALGDYPSDADDLAGPRDKVRIAEARPVCTSCEQCQLRKGKCDRGQPICGWCAANGKACEYKQRKKPGLRAGYGRNLERRLDMVEERLEAQARTIEQLEQARSRPQLTSTYATSNAGTSPAPMHRPSVSSIVVPQLYAPARSRSHSNVFATSWTDSPQASLPEAGGFSDPHGTHLSPAVPDDASGGALAGFTDDPDLPPTDMLFSLSDLYFLHINQWFPLLDRRTTMERLFGSGTWTESDKMLLHAITATTIRFCTDPRLDEAARQQYHYRSKQTVLLYGMENASVPALQALVIVALNFVGQRNGGPGLNLLALIARATVQLGLAKEAYSSPVLPAYTSNSTLGINVLPAPRDWIEDEGRRRLFWLVYILDRDATVATAFDFALDEKDIDRKLPCKDELYVRNKAVETKWFQTADRRGYAVNDPGTLGALSYLVELKGLLTKIHQFLKQPVDIGALADVEKWQTTYRELDVALREWRQNLPPEFRSLERISNANRSGRPVDCGWILLQATYYTVSIRLHSAAAYPPHKSPIFSPSYSASQACFHETESIIALARHVLHRGLLPQLGPPFAFALWVGARVLLVHGSTIEKHVAPTVHFLIDMLRQIGGLWPVAARYGAILQRVMDDYQAQAQISSDPHRPASLSSTVPILADMRRCAYDLDLLITSHHGGHGRPLQNQPRRVRRTTNPRSNTLQTPSSTTSAATSAWWPRNASQTAQTSTPMSAGAGTRFPDSSELEYLEAFDFFNYPRLQPNAAAVQAGYDMTGAGEPGVQQAQGQAQGGSMAMDVNIDQFSVDPGADWLVGQNFG